MWWQIGLVANAIVAVAYLLISAAVLRPLIAARQVRSNRLGAATAAIFLTCAIHHGGHSVHMLLPYFGVARVEGTAMRVSYDAQMAFWDLLTAAVGIYYWSLRRTYGSLMRGAQLFEDMQAREQQALELNDNVLQGLVVAKMAVELGREDTAVTALEASIAAASAMISGLLGAPSSSGSQRLLRSRAAVLHPDQG